MTPPKGRKGNAKEAFGHAEVLSLESGGGWFADECLLFLKDGSREKVEMWVKRKKLLP